MKKAWLIMLAMVVCMTAIAYTVDARQTKSIKGIIDPPPPPQGEEITVTGQVLDENGEPMIGVSIVEKGTTNGTITDYDGKYSIKCHKNCILIFSFIGMQSQEVKVTKTVINVRLLPDSDSLEEVVI